MGKSFRFLVAILSITYVFSQEAHSSENSDAYERQTKIEETNFNDVKLYRKRIETVDGVEIASSYIEYIDLAFGDIDDRLTKAYTKLTDFKERITKRGELHKEINLEITKRKQLALDLSAKDKFLRTRLIRNTEMKSALQNLADIAGYKLNSDERGESELPNKFIDILNSNEHITSTHPNISHVLAASLTTGNNSTYTRYIEMAYTEVNGILTSDKQTLIEVIRKLRTNAVKLKDLEELKVKVKGSLERLGEFEGRLETLIEHDEEIAGTLIRLERKIKENRFDSDGKDGGGVRVGDSEKD